MSHLLEEKIAVLRGRARRLVAVYGLSWVLAAVLGAVVVLGVIDYLVRLQDPGLRVICSLVLLGVLGWTCYRFLYLALMVRLRDVDLAFKVQRRFPALGDRLLSAVEFLRQPEDDPLAGSATLRRAVITRTTAETERLDFSDVLDRRPPLRAAVVTAAVCLVVAILVMLDPHCSRIAVARLVNPLGTATWPQKTHLKLRKRVERVACGQAFEVEVIDARGAKLPPKLRIHYHFKGPDAGLTGESQPMRLISGAMLARRENVIRPFSYRITGGDDDSMQWTAVEVVEPPAVESLSIRLVPPPYTGWPPEQADRHIRALVGTKLEIAGKATKPLESAALYIDGDEIPARISDDGYRFTVTVIIERSGAYWFELTDREGLTGGRDDRCEIRAVPDSPPTVTIEQPSDNLFVTSHAVVPLRVSVKDDLAVQQVDLVFKSCPRTTPQFSGGAELGDRRVVDYRWELAPLELSPGTELSFHATATDYKPQSGTSQPRRLIVITAEELQDRIAGRQSLILAELARVLKMQRAGRSQVGALEIRLREIGRLGQHEVDHLQAAELNQRQVNRSLTSRSEGVPMHILALLADMENNQVDSPDIRRRMQGLLGEIERLRREHLTLIGRNLTTAIKAARVGLHAPRRMRAGHFSDQLVSPVARSLTDAAKHQDHVIASLEGILGQLAQWDNYHRFHREVGQLLRDQKGLARRTRELGRRTLTKQLKDLQPQELADLKILARRQLELARRFDRVGQGMEQAAGELRSSDPLAAETVADALQQARRLTISAQMRSSGAQLGRNQIGQAIARQKHLVADLQEVLDVLANRRGDELVRLVKKLAEAEADLAEIERRQTGLLKKLEENSQGSDQTHGRGELQRLGREQEQLQQQTERLARRLQQLLAEQAGRTVGRAAAQMARAGQSAGQGDQQRACRQAEDALKTLEQARRQLAARRRRAEVDLAVEQLARLEDALKHIHQQQQQTIEETQRYEALWQAQGQLTRVQAAGLSDLARLERGLQTKTGRLSDKIVGAGPFKPALSGATRHLGRAAELLDRRQTGQSTLEAERSALGHLHRALEALKTQRLNTEPSDADHRRAGQQSFRPPVGQPRPKQDAGSAKPTAGSQRPNGDGKTYKPDMQQMREVMKQLWGELPPHQREQMLQLPLEEFLPKYELLIEEYFRRLSEEKKR